MTKKRYGITPELPKGWTDIIDTDNDRTLCNIRIEYANNMIKLLNELYEENMKLKSENEYLRCTIEDYKSSEECNKEFINNLHDYNQKLKKENEQLKKDLKRCREWINSDKYDYETTLAFIKSKGYSLKDVLEYKGDME